MKRLFPLLVLALTGCANLTTEQNKPNFMLPDKILFQDERFDLVQQTQLDEMKQALYLPNYSDKNPNQWQKAIFLLIDKNTNQRELVERAKFREQHFAKQNGVVYDIRVNQNELKSLVAYPPSEQENNVMLEVSRGRNSLCGFEQMQFADKRLVFAEKSQKLGDYQTDLKRLAQLFDDLAWQIECK